MPSKSKKQKRFMAAAAHNPKFAKKAGIKQSVAKEYHAADKAKGYAEGGSVKDTARAILGSHFTEAEYAQLTAEDKEQLLRKKLGAQHTEKESRAVQKKAKGGKIGKLGQMIRAWGVDDTKRYLDRKLELGDIDAEEHRQLSDQLKTRRNQSPVKKAHGGVIGALDAVYGGGYTGQAPMSSQMAPPSGNPPLTSGLLGDTDRSLLQASQALQGRRRAFAEGGRVKSAAQLLREGFREGSREVSAARAREMAESAPNLQMRGVLVEERGPLYEIINRVTGKRVGKPVGEAEVIALRDQLDRKAGTHDHVIREVKPKELAEGGRVSKRVEHGSHARPGVSGALKDLVERVARSTKTIKQLKEREAKLKEPEKYAGGGKVKSSLNALKSRVQGTAGNVQKTRIRRLVNEMNRLHEELAHAGTPGHKNEHMTRKQEDALVSKQEKIAEELSSLGVDVDDLFDQGS